MLKKSEDFLRFLFWNSNKVIESTREQACVATDQENAAGLQEDVGREQWNAAKEWDEGGECRVYTNMCLPFYTAVD